MSIPPTLTSEVNELRLRDYRVYALTTRTSQARFMLRGRRDTGINIPS